MLYVMEHRHPIYRDVPKGYLPLTSKLFPDPFIMCLYYLDRGLPYTEFSFIIPVDGSKLLYNKAVKFKNVMEIVLHELQSHDPRI